MIVVQITHHIHPEYIDRYLKATSDNARATRLEVGNLRFDVLRDADDPCAFQLYEVYVDRDAQQAHLGSAHFKEWKNAVLDCFASRSIQKFEAIDIQ